MPINVIGKTDITDTSAVASGKLKSVCIICKKDKTGNGETLKLLPIFSTSDAADKIGTNNTALGMVRTLINNRVPQIFVMIAPPQSDEKPEETNYALAFDELLKYNVDIVLIDDMDIGNITLIKEHLDKAEAEDKYRYSVVSSDVTETAELATFQKGINHSRIFIAAPLLTDMDGNTVDPAITAAGLASLIAIETNDPALPMNGVEVKGFGGVSQILMRDERKSLVDGGITPFYSDTIGGTPVVYRLVTSYTTDTDDNVDKTWQEGTTRFIADDVLNTVRRRILTNYKRSKNVARILDAMRTDVIDILERKEGLEIIQNVNPDMVTVVKDPNDIYGALIDYEYDVVTPLYTVTIRQHIKL